MNNDDTFAPTQPIEQLKEKFNEVIRLATQSGSNIELAAQVDALSKERDHYKKMALDASRAAESWKVQCIDTRRELERLCENRGFMNGDREIVIRVEPTSGELTAEFRNYDPYPNE